MMSQPDEGPPPIWCCGLEPIILIHTIPILGATSVAQLEQQLSGLEVPIPDDLKSAIDDLNRAWPMPY